MNNLGREFDGGEGGIRTLGAGLPAQLLSRQPCSSTPAPLRRTQIVSDPFGHEMTILWKLTVSGQCRAGNLGVSYSLGRGYGVVPCKVLGLQERPATPRWRIKFQLSGASGRWPDHSGMKLESLPRSRFRLRRMASTLARRFAKIFRSLKRQRESD